jgi:DNA modification methylase
MYISKVKLKNSLFFYNEKVHLLLGDCMEILKNIEDNSIDLIFADPPYFLSRKNGSTYKNGKIQSVYKGQWDEVKTLEEKNNFNNLWIKECYRILKDTGTIWITGSKHNIYSIGVNLEKENFQIINNIAWIKNNATPNISKRVFSFDNESIIWAKKQNTKGYIFNYKKMIEINNGIEMNDVWEIPVVSKFEKTFGQHPTQKPLELLERIINGTSIQNAIILDPFAGSSTTGVAAIRNGRRYIGIDKNVEYLELSKRRILDL